MYSHLLTLLADHLEYNVKESEFNLTHWKTPTTACAIGHAADIPALRQRGFYLSSEIDNRTNPIPVFQTPDGELLDDWDAIMVLFDITYKEAAYLFLASKYVYPPTRDNVIKRIRDFVREKAEIKPDIV